MGQSIAHVAEEEEITSDSTPYSPDPEKSDA